MRMWDDDMNRDRLLELLNEKFNCAVNVLSPEEIRRRWDHSNFLEKTYHPSLEMIDELAELKGCFQKCLDEFMNNPEFHSISYDFEMENTERKITGMLSGGTSDALHLKGKDLKVIFSIALYEK